MRKLILTMLLASSVAAPAMAQDRDFGGRDRAAREAPSEERQQAREARRAERAAERQQQATAPRQVEPQRSERRDRGTWERRRSDSGSYADNGQVLSEQRDFRRGGNRTILQQVVDQSRQRDGQVTAHRDRDRDGRWDRRHSDSRRQWSNHWRSDRSYDWRRYRDRNRSIFRLGNYWDPYGSRYRRFSIGFSLFPSYYSQSYWLSDPWQYRLPPAYGPYRWVRYYDDALLVNIYTGQVVDVLHNFFW